MKASNRNNAISENGQGVIEINRRIEDGANSTDRNVKSDYVEFIPSMRLYRRHADTPNACLYDRRPAHFSGHDSILRMAKALPVSAYLYQHMPSR